MTDVALIVLSAILQLLITGYAVDVSVREKRLKNAVVIGVLGLIAIVFTGIAAVDSDREAKELHKEVSTTNDKLEVSLREQARMSGHLEGIQTVMENFSKSGWPGMSQIATAISTLSRKDPHDARISTKELCDRAHALATKMRTAQAKYSQDEQDRWEQDIANERNLPPDSEQLKQARRASMEREMKATAQQDFDNENQFLGDAKYIQDLAFSRLSAKERDALVAANGMANTSLVMGRLMGGNVYVVASYLDQIGNIVCQSTTTKPPS